MSPSWRERIVVSLEPGAARALRMHAREQRSADGPWRDSLSGLLAGWQGGSVTVVVSNRMVRYAVVPPNAHVQGEDEAHALARHHFARVHGECVAGWHIRYSPAAGLASAVDVALIDGLKEAFAPLKGLRLVSLQPYLMAAFNRWRFRIPRTGAWLVLPEAHGVCVALYARGFQGVSVTRSQATVEALLTRERLRFGGPNAPETVLTESFDDPYAMAQSAL